MSEEQQKRIRKLEDNNLKMQQKQDDILDSIQELKECTITKDEMDLANEKLVERIFTKVEKNFARKEKVENLQKSFNRAIALATAVAIGSLTFILNEVINII